MSDFYTKIEQFTSQSYFKDLNFNEKLLREALEITKIHNIRQLRNENKILRKFVEYDISDWVNRINLSKNHKRGSLNYFIILYGEFTGKMIYDNSNIKRKNKIRQIYFESSDQFLKQKPFKDFSKFLNKNSLIQIEKVIKKYDKRYLLNLRKEMVVNLLKHNVDGDWIYRLNESEKYKKMSCSLEACIARYGEKIGPKIYDEHIKSVVTKKENFTEDEWRDLCNKKRSNLGLSGYIEKYGEEIGAEKWNKYFKKWKIGIENRKLSGKWKNGRSLQEYQERDGIKLGYDKWRKSYDKRNYTLSLNGFVDRFGKIIGREKYFLHIEKMSSNCRTGKSYSKISQELFNDVYSKLDFDKQSETKYFTLNEEQSFYAEGECGLNLIYVDFKCKNVIIEFDGTYWHSFPSIIDRDNRRNLFLESRGYKILRIPENDYIENKQKTVEKCINFINENCK